MKKQSILYMAIICLLPTVSYSKIPNKDDTCRETIIGCQSNHGTGSGGILDRNYHERLSGEEYANERGNETQLDEVVVTGERQPADSGWGGSPLSPGVRPGRNGSSAGQGPEGGYDYIGYCAALGPTITELNQYLQEMTRQGYSQSELRQYIELRDNLQAQLDGGVCEWDPNRTTSDF